MLYKHTVNGRSRERIIFQFLRKLQMSCTALLHCLGALGSATPAMHCHTARGRWAVDLLQCAGPPAGGTGRPAQEAVATERAHQLQCNATLPGRSGQWKSCNALPHYLGAKGSEVPAMHRLIAWGQREVELLQCTATLPGGSGHWFTLPSTVQCIQNKTDDGPLGPSFSIMKIDQA